MSEWGTVPAGLVMSRYRKIAGVRSSEYKRLSLTLGGVVPRTRDDAEGLQPTNFEGYQVLPEGSLVFKLIDLENVATSRVGLSTETGIVSPAYIVVQTRSERLFAKFGYYAFWDLYKRNYFNSIGSDGVRSALNYSDLARIRIPLPPLETQQRIADYLDRETAEIDAAVADLDKYMGLLEKRKWQQLNEILENSRHSRVRLSVAAKMKTGTTPSTLIENEEGVPWLKPDGLGVQSTGQRIDFEMLGESLLSPGGTTYVCGIGATLGKVGYSEEPSVTNQQITALTPVLNIIPKLFYYSVLTLTDWLRRTAPGSTLPILNNTRLGTYSVRIPDLDVQQTVLAEMESLFHETDQIIAESTKLRDLLVKRRAVMITDVVTGRKQV